MKNLKKTVQRAMAGDRGAFGELYNEYALDLYCFALSICKNPQDAQDSVQETALAVFKSISTLKNPDKFKAYLFTSLSNTCKKKMGKLQPQAEFYDTGYTDSEIEFSIPVRMALEKLDSTSREILMLSVVGGFRSHEIGKMLNMPSATVRTKQKRAIEKMREELEF